MRFRDIQCDKVLKLDFTPIETARSTNITEHEKKLFEEWVSSSAYYSDMEYLFENPDLVNIVPRQSREHMHELYFHILERFLPIYTTRVKTDLKSVGLGKYLQIYLLDEMKSEVDRWVTTSIKNVFESIILKASNGDDKCHKKTLALVELGLIPVYSGAEWCLHAATNWEIVYCI